MFEKILFTNRGDQPRSGAAAQLNRTAAAGSSNPAAEATHV
jgi:hypothetical protein